MKVISVPAAALMLILLLQGCNSNNNNAPSQAPGPEIQLLAGAASRSMLPTVNGGSAIAEGEIGWQSIELYDCQGTPLTQDNCMPADFNTAPPEKYYQQLRLHAVDRAYKLPGHGPGSSLAAGLTRTAALAPGLPMQTQEQRVNLII